MGRTLLAMGKHPSTDSLLLTSGEAASILGMSRDTVSRAADRGELSVIRTPGGQRRFSLSDVIRYKEELTSMASTAAAAGAAATAIEAAAAALADATSALAGAGVSVSAQGVA